MQHILRSQAELLLSQKNKIVIRPVDVSFAIGIGKGWWPREQKENHE